MPWVYLIAAGLFEVGFASTLKLTDGFTKLWPTLIFTVCIATLIGSIIGLKLATTTT